VTIRELSKKEVTYVAGGDIDPPPIFVPPMIDFPIDDGVFQPFPARAPLDPYSGEGVGGRG